MLPVDLRVDPRHVGRTGSGRSSAGSGGEAGRARPPAGSRPRARSSRPPRCRESSLNSSKRERPRSLARYIAASASRITVSGATVGSATIAIPTLTVTVSSMPSTSIGGLAAWQMRSAISTTSRSEVRSSNRNVNSSPPNRATVSIGRSSVLSRSPSAASRRSPTAWPRVSLISLKLSKSRNMTASWVPERRARSSATPSRSRNSARLGSPVSWSWSAWWASSASARLRSIAWVSARRSSAGVELGLDQAVLGAGLDRLERQRLVLAGATAARSGPRARTAGRTRAGPSPRSRPSGGTSSSTQQDGWSTSACAAAASHSACASSWPRLQVACSSSSMSCAVRQSADSSSTLMGPACTEFPCNESSFSSNSSTSLLKPAHVKIWAVTQKTCESA